MPTDIFLGSVQFLIVNPRVGSLNLPLSMLIVNTMKFTCILVQHWCKPIVNFDSTWTSSTIKKLTECFGESAAIVGREGTLLDQHGRTTTVARARGSENGEVAREHNTRVGGARLPHFHLERGDGVLGILPERGQHAPSTTVGDLHAGNGRREEVDYDRLLVATMWQGLRLELRAVALECGLGTHHRPDYLPRAPRPA